ncbi:nickel pincer cofactor biosynthesis protein LarC [Nonomuraea sp. 3-1Str]|uniref:nickel pincer cofactor biosynthesis protein LarC n=1 Tax=Nonomuraea sp. 3-1Str TaxID=2929801 RepID=UPI0028581287|nr:nickel pincer cofactor biosynthesis protein LarC [Nonomuraea sp. 3-1Str]MDR8412431.1 nickel pincer cofactor biosynthesis protein LarC [Nonomuraea sp. 3-1Str]
MRHAWIDASAGVAGDMLLGALLDAGARLETVRAAVEAVVPGQVRLGREQVTRAGLRATRAHVTPAGHGHHRTWRDIRLLLTRAEPAEPVRENALAVFARLARAEARVHGIEADEVHFHEVGAWDSIADVVGVCAALHDLDVSEVSAGPVAVGSGRVVTAHGELPVPVPAVAELAAGWRIHAGGQGELATPTGMALVTTLARECTELPPLRLEATGVGAGARDTPGRANVVRVLVGAPGADPAEAVVPAESVVLEANVDDLDPRVWPSVLSALMEAGASDAWLVPILMKKGRPAHTLSVLSPPGHADELRAAMFHLTTTLGVRERTVRKTALERGWVHVDALGARLPVKVGHRDGVVVQATPEYEPAARLAAERGLPVRTVLDAAVAAAWTAGLAPGRSVPRELRPHPSL